MGHLYKHIQGHISGVFRPGLLPTGREPDAPSGSVEITWGDGTALTWGDGTVVEWSNA